MIARNWINISDKSQVINTRLFSSSPSLFQPYSSCRSNPANDANMRDREVPYGMKGGEH